MIRFKSITCFLIGAALLACSKGGDSPSPTPTPPTPPTPPASVTIVCMTGGVSSVTGTSATFSGSASVKGASSQSGSACFYYSDTKQDAASLKTSGRKLSAGTIPSSGGDFSATASNLNPSTTYHYVASVIIDGQEELGSVKDFTTKKQDDTDINVDIGGWDSGDDIRF